MALGLGVGQWGFAAPSDCAVDTATPAAQGPIVSEIQQKLLSKLAGVLNKFPFYSEEFSRAVREWPREIPIWPHLKTRAVRESFVRYVLLIDDTSKRKYESFDALCTGFAAQFYARYSTRCRLDDQQREGLKDAKVDARAADPKYRFPIVMASYPGHFYNAILFDESKPEDFGSYLILEPQRDLLIDQKSRDFDEYVGQFGVRFSDLTDYTDRYAKVKQYFSTDAGRFFVRGDGKIVSIKEPKILSFAQDFLIMESGILNFNTYAPGLTYQEFIRKRVGVWAVNDDDLVSVGVLLVGREIREKPGVSPEKLTVSRYLELIGKPQLKVKLETALKERIK